MKRDKKRIKIAKYWLKTAILCNFLHKNTQFCLIFGDFNYLLSLSINKFLKKRFLPRNTIKKTSVIGDTRLFVITKPLTNENIFYPEINHIFLLIENINPKIPN